MFETRLNANTKGFHTKKWISFANRILAILFVFRLSGGEVTEEELQLTIQTNRLCLKYKTRTEILDSVLSFGQTKYE